MPCFVRGRGRPWYRLNMARAATKSGIGIGVLLTLGFGTVYIVLLREPGFLFYPFAALIFIATPAIAATAAILRANTDKPRVFARVASAVLGLGALLFVLTYAVYPAFERTSVPLPQSCGVFGGAQPTASFGYNLPGIGATTLLAKDGQTALVAAVDFGKAPFPSTVYLVREPSHQILWSTHFDNDIISAAIDDGTLYLYNDKIGYWIDIRTGLPEKKLFTIDNYGGLSETDRPIAQPHASTGRWYMETMAVISSWNRDGSVRPRRRVTFNSIAFNCLVAGATGSVTRLWN